MAENAPDAKESLASLSTSASGTVGTSDLLLTCIQSSKSLVGTDRLVLMTHYTAHRVGCKGD